MPGQQALVVAMVVFEGKNSAEKLHLQAVKGAFPDFAKATANSKARRRSAPQLHYMQMNATQKSNVGTLLAKGNILCFSSIYWHTDEFRSHDTKFSIYTELVKSCISIAFKHYDDLEIAIAQQGGVNAYRQKFLGRLRSLPDEHSKQNGTFKKAGFELANVNPGIQIADFYAGAIRDFVISKENTQLQRAYELIDKQIVCIETVTYDLLKK